MNLIELKDDRLCLRSEQGVLAQSPGYANITGKEPVFGEAALRIARLHPRETFNQFWYQPSLDPLLIKTKHFRHHADLAYGHLTHLLAGNELNKPALVAASTASTRTQLGVLLGVLKQTGLPIKGLVDHSLLQAAATGSPDCIVLDLQLHQAVLVAFAMQEGALTKLKAVPVPGAGLLALQDAWTSVISDEFLAQSRFNPTHSAETEQYIANQLDTWLAASAKAGELQIEINHKGTSYQARISHDQFVQRTRAMFARIARELPALRTPQSSVHVHAAHLVLPGLTTAFPGIMGIADSAAYEVALQHRQRLLQNESSLAFLTRLAVDAGAVSTTAAVKQPTHLLYRHQAVALPAGRLALGSSTEGVQADRTLNIDSVNGTLVLQRSVRGVTIELHGMRSIRINGAAVASGHSLSLGDCIELDGHDAPLQLIQVE